MRHARLARFGGTVVVAVALSASAVWGRATRAWVDGDIVAGIEEGVYEVYDNTGAFVETISDTTSFSASAGCAFTPSPHLSLYGTGYTLAPGIPGRIPIYTNDVPHSTPVSIVPGTVPNRPFSIVFNDAGHFFVGSVSQTIEEYDAAGANVASHVMNPGSGATYLDLTADQHTLFTAGGRRIMRFDLLSDTQLADFGPGLPPISSGEAVGLRLLPDGGLLVADTEDVKRLDNTGAVVQRYRVPGETGQWQTLSLDPDGLTFWSGTHFTHNIYRFSIEGGGPPLDVIHTGGLVHSGLCIRGELGAARGFRLRGVMLSRAALLSLIYGPTRYEVALTCEIQPPNGPIVPEFVVRWPIGHTFTLDAMTSAQCSRNPKAQLKRPLAFTTHTGSGTGRVDGIPGYQINWVLNDNDGNPQPQADTAQITITNLQEQGRRVPVQRPAERGAKRGARAAASQSAREVTTTSRGRDTGTR